LLAMIVARTLDERLILAELEAVKPATV